MPIEIVTVKTKGNGVTSEQVNRLERSLAKNRVLGSDGFMTTRFNVLTDESEGVTQHAKLRELHRDDRVTNELWYQLQVFDMEDYGVSTESKTIFIDPSIVATELVHQIIFDSLPHKGEPEQSSTYRLSNEEMDFVEQNKSAFIVMAPSWDSFGANTYIDGFHAHSQGDVKEMWSYFLENAEQVQSEWGDNVHGFIEWYVAEMKQFIIPLHAGTIGRYFVNDQEKNKQLNADYEENVRPLFPKAWRGIGGEEEAKYMHFEHEYRDLTRQTSFLRLEGESTDNPAASDRWLDLWIL